jgi:hypothetical protein
MFDSYVEISHKLNHDRNSIFPSINFHLNSDRLLKLERYRAKHRFIKLSSTFVSNFRYLASIDRQNYLHSGLTFCTYYQQDERKQIAIRSVIFLNGEINQQICSDLLQHPELARQLISLHYWLSEQLLQKLFLTVKPSLNLSLLSLSLSSIFISIAAFILFNFQYFQINIINILIVLTLFLLVSEVIRRLLQLFLPKFKFWSLHQLLFGLFSDRQTNSQLVFKFLKLTGF